MFLKFNDTFPTVVHDNELPNELIQDLRNHELQKSKMSMNEETHVHVYESLILLVEEISRIRMRDIVDTHCQLFHLRVMVYMTQHIHQIELGVIMNN